MKRARTVPATGEGGAHWLRGFATSDVVGAALGLFGAGWTLATSGTTPAARRVAGLYLAAVAGFFVGRTIARRISLWLPAFAGVAFAAVVAISDGRTYTAGPSDRFWYANARAAFFVLAALAAAMVLASTERPAIRVLSWGAIAGFATVPVASRAVAASVMLAVSLVGALVAGKRATTVVRWAVASFVVAVVLTAGVGALAADHHPGAGTAERVVGERRVALWADAAHLLETHPLRGVGAGRFQSASPTARADRDARWAHNGFLQQGAEAGVVGMTIAVGLFLWALAAAATGSGPVAALGVVCVAVLGILSCLDFLLHFAVLPITAAALAGVGAAAD